MATQEPKQVYELAGQQDDPVVEDVIFSLFTDQPVRDVESPGDTRNVTAWQLGYVGGSRLWMSFAKPLTDETSGLVVQRAKAALAWMIPVVAKTVDVTAKQITFDTIKLDIGIVTPSNRTIELSYVLPGGSGA
jgi:phage gp46-like protein